MPVPALLSSLRGLCFAVSSALTGNVCHGFCSMGESQQQVLGLLMISGLGDQRAVAGWGAGGAGALARCPASAREAC